MLDPRISLATAVHGQGGVYALLAGSGVSTGAGIPTGWGVVNELVGRAAAASGDESDLDPEAWWADNGDGEPLGYSNLLAALASTPAARRALIASFFEPTDEDRENGLKVPGAALRAISNLVQRGAVRVVLTTNFDRLIEQALEADGLMPQVVSSAAGIAGMEPLAHARCTVIKLHGDYAALDQRNTIDELAAYEPEMQALLDRVLDEYGLVVSGWSAEWDTALVTSIEGTRSRRYPLYWASYGDLTDPAERLVAQHHAHVIGPVTADEFFPDLVGRLEALDSFADPPLSKSLAIARLKRALPDPTKHITVRDLLDGHAQQIRDHLAERPTQSVDNTPTTIQSAHNEMRERTDTLIELLATGVYFDRDRLHTDTWVWTIEQLMRARRVPNGAFNQWWDDLAHLPALLAMRTVALAAVAARRDDVLIRALTEPSWRDRLSSLGNVAAFDALHDYKVLSADHVNSFPSWNGQKWLYPYSHYLRAALEGVFIPIVGDPESYKELCNRTEFRIALVQYRTEGSGNMYRAAPGEFIGEWAWTHEDRPWAEVDFREHADCHPWGWHPVASNQTDKFEEDLDGLVDDLRKSRRWG